MYSNRILFLFFSSHLVILKEKIRKGERRCKTDFQPLFLISDILSNFAAYFDFSSTEGKTNKVTFFLSDVNGKSLAIKYKVGQFSSSEIRM